MRTSYIVLGLIFGIIISSLTYADDAAFAISAATTGVASVENERLAASGCCKERKSKDSPWRKIKGDLDSCKKANDKKDNKDNVFKPIGFIWWDIAC